MIKNRVVKVHPLFKNKFGSYKILSYICIMKKKETKEPKPKKVVEYFTDDMAKDIFVFQDTYKANKGGSPIMKSVSFAKRKK
jgi:hypothetical protein